MAVRPEAASATQHILHYDNFPPVYTKIQLPENSHFYRGYDATHAAVSERPAYYAHRADIANGHGAQTDAHRVGLFRTTRPLQLYDLRYIAALLREHIRQRNAARDRNGAANAGIHAASLALGLCSFHAQLALFRARYSDALEAPEFAERLAAMERYARDPPANGNPVELEGVRIAEGANDAELIALLSDLFGDDVDGYISPQLSSPYHAAEGGYLNAELVIFNPLRSGIAEVPLGDAETAEALRDLRHYPILALLASRPGEYHMECYAYAEVRVPEPKGHELGAAAARRGPEHASVVFDEGGPRYKAIRARAAEIADAWKHSSGLYWQKAGYAHPNPIFRCSPWNLGPDGSLMGLKESPAALPEDKKDIKRSAWEL